MLYSALLCSAPLCSDLLCSTHLDHNKFYCLYRSSPVSSASCCASCPCCFLQTVTMSLLSLRCAPRQHTASTADTAALIALYKSGLLLTKPNHYCTLIITNVSTDNTQSILRPIFPIARYSKCTFIFARNENSFPVHIRTV
jgi:hypothetical protein